MLYYYFEMDIINRKIKIYNSYINISDSNFNLSDSKAINICFNDVFSLIEDYKQKHYLQEIKDICDTMVKDIIEGKAENLMIEEKYKSLRLKFRDNIFAIISLDLLYNVYEPLRNRIAHPGLTRAIFNAISSADFNDARKQISSAYDNIELSINELLALSDMDFENIFYSHKFISQCLYTDTDNRSMVPLYSMNESFSVFNYVFVSTIKATGLKICICKNCGKRFFEKTATDYCPSEECQNTKIKAANKLKKARRKEDPYKKLCDKFNTHIDQQTYILKAKGMSTEEIEEFKQTAEQVKYNVKMEVSVYGDTLKPLPPEIEKTIDEYKSIAIQKRDEILMRHGIKLTRGRPKKKPI